MHSSIIFGRGRFQNGVLIEPTEPFDPRDDLAQLLAKPEVVRVYALNRDAGPRGDAALEENQLCFPNPITKLKPMQTIYGHAPR